MTDKPHIVIGSSHLYDDLQACRLAGLQAWGKLRPMTIIDQVAQLLAEIKWNEQADNYDERNRRVYELLAVAAWEEWPCGVRLDPAEPEWPVVYVDLPGVGQVSWHVPQYPQPWDGHSTEEKYKRADRYAATAPPLYQT